MKVFNLRCAGGHGFEGWFGSDDELSSQRERGLLACPLCGNAQVQKMPSAPRLNLRTPSGRPSGDEPARHHGPPEAVVPERMDAGAQAQVRLHELVHQLVSQAEDVGAQFPEQALAMHHGDMEPRAIRGQATAEQAHELLDEGVPLLALPVIKKTLH